MMNRMSLYVKSAGITLPDGSVFGAGTEEGYRVVEESGMPGYKVYEVIGTKLLNLFGDGKYVSWREMRDALNERIAYQISIGNKVLRAGEEITEI